MKCTRYNNGFSVQDAYFVISAGTSNKNQHPHKDVIADLKGKHDIFLVTEAANTRVDFECDAF